MQFQSDILGVTTLRPVVAETTALGAAYLAWAPGLAVGFWINRKEIAEQWQEDARFKSKMKPARRKELLTRWEQGIGACRQGWESLGQSATCGRKSG